jgi:hypothetical protein
VFFKLELRNTLRSPLSSLMTQMMSLLSPSNTSHLFPYHIIHINTTLHFIIKLTTFEKNTTNIYIYIQRQQRLKAYVTFHTYSYIYSSHSKLRFYLVVVLTYKGNHEVPKLFKLKILNIILWMGYPYGVLPHNHTNLDTKCYGSTHLESKK